MHIAKTPPSLFRGEPKLSTEGLTEFNKLELNPHELASIHINTGYHATYSYPNGYGVSVLKGSAWHSNGHSTYEVAVLAGGRLTQEIRGYQTPEEVNSLMLELSLKSKFYKNFRTTRVW